MARVVIGGLATSTVITLVFIPVMYVAFEELFYRRRVAQPTMRAAESVAGD
jgi:Cu/Ag efflux pump CusA